MTQKKRIINVVLYFLIIAIMLASFFYESTKMTVLQTKEVEAEKICYLTFDDGPSYNTPKVLNILKRYNVKATFFLIGSEIEKEDRTILEQMELEGHAIGLHSNLHDFDKVYLGADKCVEDYLTEYELLKNEYDIETVLFRFPGGSACTYMNGQRETYIKQMRAKGFRCFDWHVSGEDSVGSPSAYTIRKNVLEQIKEYKQPIVLLHDSGIADQTVEALPNIIESIREAGYSFQTLQEREEYIFRWKKDK